MLNRIRNLILSTPIGKRLWRSKKLKEAKSWVAQDDSRAEFYGQFIEKGDLVFDVGANVGNRTKVFLKLGARVVAFEPQRVCADIIEKAFADREFQCVRRALGEKPGEIEMHMNSLTVLSTVSKKWISDTAESGRFKNAKWENTETVPMTTLDHAIEEFGSPVFIKIDVEGYEKEVVAGLTKTVPMISLEFASEALDAALENIAKFQSMGLDQFQFSHDESMQFSLPKWVDGDAMSTYLKNLVAENKLAWGDMYIRHNG